jgi:hypothetical protein
MLARPRVGRQRYLQGFAPDIEFLDTAKVFNAGRRVRVPLDLYNDVVVTDETSPLDRSGGHQRKFHAPGVGIVKIDPVGDPEAETLSWSNCCASVQSNWRALARGIAVG